ncbi:MAG: hypothetical protein H7Z13_10805 [Ferruginibacter sp.]|nr:hypothetical protein [Ferruginibacter sp.]
MHNLSNEYFQNEFESSTNEYGYEISPEFEFNNEYSGETGYELAPEFEFENQEMEMYEAELTQELMEVSNEFEFLNWLKNTAQKTAGVASNFLDSPTGKKAAAALNNIAQKTLPMAGTAGGSFVGRQGGGALGGAIAGLAGPEAVPIGQAIGGWAGGKAGGWAGGKAGQWAANRFPSFVRFATDTVRDLAKEVGKGGKPQVNNSIVKAAKKYYPIILRVKGTLHARPEQGKLSNELEYNNEYNGESAYEMEGEITHNEGTFNEVTEMELASELLSIQSEAELDQFLGKLFKKAAGAVKNFAKSSTGKALGGMLKGLAKKALPIAGKALGSFIAPGIGTAVGGALGNAASNLFELELEGLSAEDREFETARAFVRFAGNSARRASRMNTTKPGGAARTAIINSARRYAPGLLAKRQTNIYNNHNDSYPTPDEGDDASQDGGPDIAQEGTWHREGSRIVLETNY